VRRLVLAGFLALCAADERVGALVERLREDPFDGAAWTSLARHEEPGEALRAVLGLLGEQPDSPAGWHALWQLADRVGDFPLGAEASRRALDLLAEAELLEDAAQAENGLCEDYFRRGLTHAERQALLRRRALLERLELPTRKIDERLERLDAEVRRRAYPDPERLRAAAADARARGDPFAEHARLVDLAYHDWATGAFREGYETYRRILEIDGPQRRTQRANNRNGAARLALELALVSEGDERAGLLREALALAEGALQEHEGNGVGSPADRVRDHCVLAHARQALGEGELARVHYEQELALVLEQRGTVAIEGDRALRIFHGVQDHIFEDFALFLAREDADVERALRVGELGRVGGLRELYRLRGLPSPAWTEQQLPLAELQRRAGEADAAVLVYGVGSHEAALVCVTADDARVVPLAPPGALAEAAEALARVAFDLAARDADVERTGRRAFDLLLAPAAEAFAGARRLVLVGAGRWGRLPFAALVRPGDGPLESRYLAAGFELAFAPTLGALLAERRPSAAAPPVSFGYDGAGPFDAALEAHFGLAGLAALSRAEAESRDVARRLGGRSLVGSAATEGAFRRLAPQASLLHFAGHALVDDEDGTRSALVLAPAPGTDEEGGEPGDGLLTLGEILELRLGARLVLLPACRTARGESFAGEGVGGMARCFLAAGAQSLLLSLAPVDDAKAPLLVSHLTDALAAGAHPATALARAQRQMLATRSHAHPAFWAAFVLYGQQDLLRRRL